MVSVPSLTCRSSDNVALSIASLVSADEDENEIALLLPVRIRQRGCILVRTTQLASPTGETNFMVNHFNMDSRVPQNRIISIRAVDLRVVRVSVGGICRTGILYFSSQISLPGL